MARRGAAPVQGVPPRPVPGEGGFLVVEYVGLGERTVWTGKHTGARYEFVKGRPRLVDRLDGLHWLAIRREWEVFRIVGGAGSGNVMRDASTPFGRDDMKREPDGFPFTRE